MQVTTYPTAQSFLARTQTLLERNEVANNVILGLANILSRTPDRYATWHLLTIDNESEIRVAALWTPPFNLNLGLLLNHTDPSALSLLAQHFNDQGLVLPGVIARVDLAYAFANAWTAVAGGTLRTALRMRLYELRRVNIPAGISGQLMLAQPEHIAVTAQWNTAFTHEALHNTTTLEEAQQIVTRQIADGALYLWCVDGEPISMAVRGRETTHGAVIGSVYTPPEQRGHGYASALVARCSQLLLDSGKSFCALFTDLSNPTSNNIYQNIGYMPVADFDEIKFDILH